MNLSEALKVDFEFTGLERPIGNSTQLALYRIVQEQFTNILKYADASVVRIRMIGNDALLTLIIADNGVGFDLKQQTAGIGLENISRRARALNGTMQLVTEPGNGCTLTVTVPFD
jgi:signal transduction histidine kinase